MSTVAPLQEVSGKGIQIHPTALVSPKAQLGRDVEIGPYCIVGDHVQLGDAVSLKSHVVIEGITQIGARTEIYPFASIGHRPQDMKYAGEKSRLVIGEGNMIREYATMQAGTKGDRMLTQVGSFGIFMAGTHVAHDCIVGDYVRMGNHATLAGHVVLEDYVILGGLSAVSQFVRIGKHSIVAGMSGVKGDVIPYGNVFGLPALLKGLNVIGLKRRGFSRAEIDSLRNVFMRIFEDDNEDFSVRIRAAQQEFKDCPRAMEVVEFLLQETSQPVCLPQ